MDIYVALRKDHDQLKSLLNELINLQEEDSFREVLIEQIEKELVPHSRAEESVFYNSIRAASPDSSDVMHSFKEHMEAEALLRSLQLKETTDLDWKSTAIKLKNALEHHIEEEEGKIFSEAKKIFTEGEARMMAKAFKELKEKATQKGFMKNSIDMVINLMPPRFIEKIKSFGAE